VTSQPVDRGDIIDLYLSVPSDRLIYHLFNSKWILDVCPLAIIQRVVVLFQGYEQALSKKHQGYEQALSKNTRDMSKL
jgi:hypothetical protein